jgi:hypothetical protein
MHAFRWSRTARAALLPALALAAGAAFVGPLGAGGAQATAAPTAALPAPVSASVPPATHGATVDWFDDKYTALGAGSVFETATMERFEYLLKKPGKYAFIIGGPDSATLQNSIGYINEVAQANGVTKIYNFNPKLDGGTLNVFDPSGLQLSAAGKSYIGAYGTGLVNNYLSKDAETPFSNAHTSDPYLFVYDGSGGDTARITGALTAPVTAADVDTPGEVTAYKSSVASVLSSAGTLNVDTQFDFIAGEHNRRLDVRNADDTKFGGDIFGPADAADGFRIQSVTYPELIHILESPGDFALLFGGTWCHNTAAIVKATNQYAQEFGIKKVYTFDFVLNTNDQSASNGGSNLLHIRDSAVVSSENRRASYLYGDLVNTYLTNAFTQYRKTGDAGTSTPNPVTYYPGGDPTKPLAEARKIQVGHVLSYNKDHDNAQGDPAPVLNQAIRKNADGTHLEYMTEWWYALGQDLPRTDTTLAGNSAVASEANLNALMNNRAFAKEGIQRVRNLFAALAGGYGSNVAVAGVPATVVAGRTIPASVTVAAPDYNGFYSNNGAGGSAAPSTGVAKPTGNVKVREGAAALGEAALTDGGASITLPALPVGTHTLSFDYTGSPDGVIKAGTTTQQVTVTSEPAATSQKAASATSVSVPGTTFGKPGGVTVSVTTTGGAPITGNVTLSGAGAAQTAPVSNGKAVFTLPADLKAGSYSVQTTYSGDSNVAGSSSSNSFTVAKAAVKGVAYKLNAKPKPTKKGKATITVAGITGAIAPSGKVTVTLARGKVVKTISKKLTKGAATLPLPKLPGGPWKLTVSYQGDANYVAWTSKAYLVHIDPA